MKIIHIVLAAITMLTAVASAQAQSKSTKAMKEEYNYRRGLECKQNRNFEMAEDYFKRAVDANSKNGYARHELAIIYLYSDRIEESINELTEAAKSPIDDYAHLTDVFFLRGYILTYIGAIEEAKADGNNCIYAAERMSPRSDNGYILWCLICEQENRYKDMADYAKVAIHIDPSDDKPYSIAIKAMRKMGREHYDEAMKIADKALYLWPRSDEFKMEKAKLSLLMGKYIAAVSLAMEALDDSDDPYHSGGANNFVVCQFDDEYKQYISESSLFDEEKFRTLVDLGLRDRMAQNPNSAKWPKMLGITKMNVNDDAAAAEYFKMAEAIDPNDVDAIYKRASCQNEIMDFDAALAGANSIVTLDSTASFAYSLRARIKERMKAPKADVMADFDKAIKFNPSAQNYYLRAWYERYNGMKEKAAEDIAAAIDLDKENVHYRLTLGNILAELGEKEMAKEEYENGLKMITDKEEKSGTEEDKEQKAYFLFYLGKSDEALALMKESCEKSSAAFINGAHYNMACLYSLMGRADDALEAMRKSFETGYTDYVHARRDNDLDNLRAAKGKEFEALVAKYEKQAKDKLAKKNAPKDEGRAKGHVAEIPFNHEGGVLTVPCVINGLPLSFIFDSGAADVTISQVEANFMFKNGYIKRSDLGDKEYYGTADGSISVGTKLLLRSVTFGGETLTNVWASVVQSQRAPLLLGQTVMKRLGKVEIDNTKQVIRIKN